jgi:hypothetical protein
METKANQVNLGHWVPRALRVRQGPRALQGAPVTQAKLDPQEPLVSKGPQVNPARQGRQGPQGPLVILEQLDRREITELLGLLEPTARRALQDPLVLSGTQAMWAFKDQQDPKEAPGQLDLTATLAPMETLDPLGQTAHLELMALWEIKAAQELLA